MARGSKWVLGCTSAVLLAGVLAVALATRSRKGPARSITELRVADHSLQNGRTVHCRFGVDADGVVRVIVIEERSNGNERSLDNVEIRSVASPDEPGSGLWVNGAPQTLESGENVIYVSDQHHWRRVRLAPGELAELRRSGTSWSDVELESFVGKNIRPRLR